MDNITAASPPRNSNPNPSASGPIVIGELDLNSRDVFVRKFYKRADGTLSATRKGLTVEIGRLPFLAETISAALDRAHADGLLPAVTP
jgi:hypothetical protein